MGNFSLWNVGSAGILNEGLPPCISGTGSDAKPGVPQSSKRGQSLCESTRTREKILEYDEGVFRVGFFCVLLLVLFEVFF